MYHIFYGNNIIFDPYGNENEVVTNASLNASINAASYLDFTMAITHPLYDVIAEKSGIVKLLWDDNVLFEGQIESIDIDMHGNKTISCVSALDYLNDTIVRPYSTISGERPLTAPSSVDGYFQWLIDQHNLHVKDSSKLFCVGVNQGANLQYNNFIYRSSNNNPTTASEITNQILDSLGGYLTMRYEDGLHVLDLYSDVHTMNTQIIDFGVNLKDFSKKIKTNEQYTALIAKGGSPQLLNGGFESGDFGYWEIHPDTEITTAKAQEGSHSSYIVEGVATYIPTSFFYAKKNGRYKSTFYVKNERSSDVTIHAGYETNVLDSWSKSSEQQAFAIKNDDQWHECVFEFTVNVENNAKVRPYWYSDNISNAGGERVYFDGFAFTRTVSGNPVSEDPIDISLIPDGGTQYDSNVIKSDDVIYNPDRVSRYGYREKVFADSTITDLDDLMQAAIKELNKLAEPTIGLDVKAVDLALYMDGYTHLTVGDVVRVRSALHDTDEYLMVTSINLNLEDPGNSEYVIGQAYDSLTGQQSGYLRSLSSGINSSLDAVASLDETTKDQAIKIGSVTEVANKAQETANTANTKAENAQTSADNAQAAADSNKAEIDAANAEIEAAKQGIADTEAEIGVVNGRINSMNGEIDTVNGHISSMNNEIAGVNGQIDSMNDEIDSLRTEVSTDVQNVKDSVDAVSSKADSAMDKASVLAGNLDATKAVVNKHSDKIGELTTSISNATTKADSALQVATEATQTANSFKTTATSAYKNANEALTQSSTAVQKANEVSLNLSKNYQTKADSDTLYATKASLKATSDSITSTVEKTYATKSSVETLQNIADSAIETWVGSVSPTGSNKPASGWNTTALKKQHSGDIYYDTSTGYSYRYGSVDGTTYSWTMIKDSDIQKAIRDAADAQLAANGAQDSIDKLALDIPNIYATKTELTQTSDSIKASVSGVTKTANSALSKATTVEQTANGLKTTVSEQATKLNQTVTTVSEVKQTAASLTSQMSRVTTDVSNINDKASSALTKASSLQQSLDGFKTNVAQTYETKTDALNKQSTLEQTVDGFKAVVSQTYETKKDASNINEKASSALTKYSELKQTLDGFKTTVSEAYETKKDALNKQSTLNQTIDGFKTNVAQLYETKTDALNKQSTLNQKVDSLRSEVSETYATKTALNNASSTTNMWPNQWFDTSKPCIGRAPVGNEIETAPVGGNIRIIEGQDNYNAEVSSNLTPGRKYKITVDAKRVSGAQYLTGGIWYTLKDTGNSYDGYQDAFTVKKNLRDNWRQFEKVVTVPSGKRAGTVYFQLGEKSNKWKISNLRFEDVTDVADIQANYSTKSYVDQTARTVSLGVVEEYKKGQHGSALATQSDISVAKGSITSTVSQTYLSKNDASAQYATKTQVQQTSDSLAVKIGDIINNPTSDNLWPNQWFDDDKPLLGSPGTEKPPSGGKSRLLAGRDHFNPSVMAPVCPGHRYRITADAKRTAGSLALRAGIWYTKETLGTPFDSCTDSTSSSSLGNDWNRYTWEVTIPSGKQAGSLYFRLEQNDSGGSTEWLVGNAVLQDITAAYDAQSIANTASSNAANAQNRVGNLETCIKMTADGVRVGKIDNGNFTGYSALANSAGSFDIVDAGGNTCSSFNQNTIKLGENNNDSVIDMGNGTVKFYGSAGSNALNIDTRDKGPITINGYDLGLIGRSCLLRQTSNKTTAQTGRWVNVPMEPAYINTKGQCATRVEPFTQDGDGVRINVKGLYLISLAGIPVDVLSTDIVRLSLSSTDGHSYIMCQYAAVESGNMMSHTEMRILDAKTYHLTYICDQGGGSNITGGFVTLTFMGYLE